MSGQSGVRAAGWDFVQAEPKPKKKKRLQEGLEMYADRESQHRFVVKRQTSGDARYQTSVNKGGVYYVIIADMGKKR
jgi:hypothetical protein